MINPDLQRKNAAIIKATTIEIKSSHVPMITEPKMVATFIIDSALSITVEKELSSELNSNDCLGDISNR
jgi:hypothetical protein